MSVAVNRDGSCPPKPRSNSASFPRGDGDNVADSMISWPTYRPVLILKTNPTRSPNTFPNRRTSISSARCKPSGTRTESVPALVVGEDGEPFSYKTVPFCTATGLFCIRPDIFTCMGTYSITNLIGWLMDYVSARCASLSARSQSMTHIHNTRRTSNGSSDT